MCFDHSQNSFPLCKTFTRTFVPHAISRSRLVSPTCLYRSAANCALPSSPSNATMDLTHRKVAVSHGPRSTGNLTSHNTVAGSETRRRLAVLRRRAQTRAVASKATPAFLSLPGELRNLIYEYVAAQETWVRNPKNPAVPRIAYHAFIYPRPVSPTVRTRYGTSAHPMTKVCHQVRSEFSYVVLNRDLGATERQRVAFVSNFNFDSLLEQLKREPSLKPGGGLLIILRITEPIEEKPSGLGRWMASCTPKSQGTSTHVVHIIHGQEYQVNFEIHPESWPLSTDASAKWMQDCIARVHSGGQRRGDFSIYNRHLNMFTRLKEVLERWKTASHDAQQPPYFKYVRNRWRPKRFADEMIERQHKRRKLCEGGEWNVVEGFDIYGDKDEEYEQLLHDIGDWTL